ncbi:MAG: helix-turn-helix transcriptional regulator, partial [Gammaproteobacteria bacterium]
DRNAALIRAVQLAPRLALTLAEVDVALAVWRQRDRDYAIPPRADPVISLHGAGRGRVRYGDGDGWSRRSTTLGTVTFLPAGVSTRWRVEGGEVEHLALTIGPRSRLRALVDGAARELEVGLPDALNVALAQALVAQLTVQEGVDRAYATSLCETLLRHFARQHRKPVAGDTRSLRSALAVRAIRDIEARFAEPLRVRELAATAGLSAPYFSELFKRETGRSPHQYLLEVRIERVREALRATGLPLGDIAQNFGFASQSHLNAAFRKRTGMTPAQYRAQHRG